MRARLIDEGTQSPVGRPKSLVARAEQLDDPDDETLFLFLPHRPGTFYVEMNLYKDATASDLLRYARTTRFRA